MTILVTGATGHVGRHVVAQLLSAGHDVRAMTRRPEEFPRSAAQVVQVVQGDLTRPGDLSRALRGVERMYLFPVPETAAEVVAQARCCGVRRIVVLSSTSVHDEQNYSGVYHRTVERAVEESGLEWTFVRPDEFATNILWKWGPSIRSEGVVRAPYPQARRALLHEADVAAVITEALVSDGHVGQSHDLTGPEALDQREQVGAISQAVGRKIRFEEVTPEASRAELIRYMPEPVVDMVLGYLAASVTGAPLMLPTVEKITGRPGTPFRQWAHDHAAEFTPTGRA